MASQQPSCCSSDSGATTAHRLVLQSCGSDCLSSIFEFCSAAGLCACQSVCQRWHHLASSNYVWKLLCTHEYGHHVGSLEEGFCRAMPRFRDWKEYFLRHLRRPLQVVCLEDPAETFPTMASSPEWSRVATAPMFSEFRDLLSRHFRIQFRGVAALTDIDVYGTWYDGNNYPWNRGGFLHPACDILIVTTSGPLLQPGGACARLIHEFVHQGGTVLLKLAGTSIEMEGYFSLSRVFRLYEDPMFYHMQHVPVLPQIHVLLETTANAFPSDCFPNGPFGCPAQWHDSCVTCLTLAPPNLPLHAFHNYNDDDQDVEEEVEDIFEVETTVPNTQQVSASPAAVATLVEVSDVRWVTATYPVLGHIPRSSSICSRLGQLLVCTNAASFLNSDTFPGSFPGFAAENSVLWLNFVSSVVKYAVNPPARLT